MIASVQRQLAEPVTGIGHERRACVRNKRHRLASLQSRNQSRPYLLGIMLVIRIGAITNAVAFQKNAGDARILAGQNIGGA